MKKCTVAGCAKPLVARGFCSMHWERWRKHGDPLGGRAPNGEMLRFLDQAADFCGVDCLLWPYGTSAGYGWVPTERDHAHRMICRRVHGEPPFADAEAAHHCGVRLCVNPAHLRWDTHTGNMADIIAERGHGPNAKLTRQQVKMIRALAMTISHKEIAARFRVSGVTVWNIVNRRTWKHL